MVIHLGITHFHDTMHRTKQALFIRIQMTRCVSVFEQTVKNIMHNRRNVAIRPVIMQSSWRPWIRCLPTQILFHELTATAFPSAPHISPRRRFGIFDSSPMGVESRDPEPVPWDQFKIFSMERPDPKRAYSRSEGEGTPCAAGGGRRREQGRLCVDRATTDDATAAQGPLAGVRWVPSRISRAVTFAEFSLADPSLAEVCLAPFAPTRCLVCVILEPGNMIIF